MINSSVSFIFSKLIAITLLHVLLLQHSKCSTFNITTVASNINEITNYTWNVNNTNCLIQNQICLINLTFSTGTTFDQENFVTQVQYSGVILSDVTISGLMISFNITGQLSDTFAIEVFNVKNPPNLGFTTFNMAIEGVALSSYSYPFSQGLIRQCIISFNNRTNHQNVTATLQFQTTSAIQGSVTFQINYGIISAGIAKLTGVQCLIQLVNQSGIIVTYQANASITNNSFINCTFNIIPNYSSYQKVILNITGVVSPTYTTGYIAGFSLMTMNNSQTFDMIQSCTETPVQVNTLDGTFQTSSFYINAVYPTPQLHTNGTVNNQFFFNDTVILQSHGISIITSGSFLSVSELSNKNNSISYNLTNQSENTYYTFVYGKQSSSTSLSDILNITLPNFVFQLPSSATPQQVVLKFFHKIDQEYLEINAELKASTVLIASKDFNIQINPNDSIGDTSSYSFIVNISQALGSNSFIKFYLPSDIQLGLDITDKECKLALSDTISCKINSTQNNSSNQTLIIYLNSTSKIDGNKTLNITIDDFINPYSPETNYSFGVQTYYDQMDPQSTVQSGLSIFSHTYKFTTMDIYINPDIIYAVNKPNSVLQFIYTPKVPLKSLLSSGLVMQFNFTSTLNQSTMISMTYQNNTLITVSNKTYNFLGANMITTFNIGQPIDMNKKLFINFGFTTPNKTTSYNATTSIIVNSSKASFEISSDILSFKVGLATLQDFSISQVLQPKTGVTTTYTVYFVLNTQHPDIFWLQVILPLDVLISNSSGCTLSPCTNNTKVIEETNEIWIQIFSNISRVYRINISNVNNPRTVGPTGTFNFYTFDNFSGSGIVYGSATAMITTPNDAFPKFSLSKSYYKNNSEQVVFNSTFSNKLKEGDYLKVFFDYRTYTIVDASLLSCHMDIYDVNYAICEIDPISTKSTTVLRINLTNPPLQISITIQGLISSNNTYYTQQFQVPVRSYDNSSRLMDQGIMIYNLSCRQPFELVEKNCQICDEKLKNCLSCYQGYFLYKNTTWSCVTNCVGASSYYTFENSTAGQCTPCINNCNTCISQYQCLTCQKATNIQFYLYENSTCQSFCPNQSGFYMYPINISQTQQRMCIACWDSLCTKCVNGSSIGCTECGNYTTQGGRCFKTCGVASYNDSNGRCSPCNPNCSSCSGGQDTDCIQCKNGLFLNKSHFCTFPCVEELVPLSNGFCGCEGNCSTCSSYSTNCTSCIDSIDMLYLYNHQCISICPEYTYIKNQNSANRSCIDCGKGCKKCSQSSSGSQCQSCISYYNLYIDNNQCYSDCKTLGHQFSAFNNSCIECNEGCDLCDDNKSCFRCTSKYTLVDDICKLTCEVDGNCPVQISIKVPLPGSIAALVWLITLVIFKIFVVKKLYFPYSFMFVGCLIEITLMAVILVNEQTMIASQTIGSRLLQNVSSSKHSDILPQKVQLPVVGLLITALALNYLSNFLFVFLFCRYLRRFIPDRQIDKISNYFVLVIGVFTNYRFSLVSYSKLFPKPNIMVENQSKLTPIHYMCIASVMFTVLPLAAAGILVYNQAAKSNLFMMGIDLLVIVVLEIIFTIWIVSVDKDDDYFESTKKYRKEQFNQTKEGLKVSHDQSQNPNYSKAMLFPSTNVVENCIIEPQQIYQSTLIDKDYGKLKSSRKHKSQFENGKEDIENEPLPTKLIKSNKSNLDVVKIRSRNQTEVFDPNDDFLDEKQLSDNSKVKKVASENGEKTPKQFKTKVEIKKPSKQQRQSPNKPKDPQDRNKSKDPQARSKSKDPQDQSKSKQPQDHNRQSQLEQFQSNIKSKIRELPSNFSKEKKPFKFKNPKYQTHTDSYIEPKFEEGLKKHSKKSKEQHQRPQSQCFEQESPDNISQSTFKQQTSQVYIKKEKKPLRMSTQRSQIVKPTTMKKRQPYGVFESQKDTSQVDEIDLDSLIKTKIIEKNRDKADHAGDHVSEHVVYEECSPSWFNIQNQRFDVDDSSDV